jgi:hypothetical protein
MKMKRSWWFVIAIGAAIVLVIALVGFRERGFFGGDEDEDETAKTASSSASAVEKSAPLQPAGQTQAYNFEGDKLRGNPCGFPRCPDWARDRGQVGGDGGFDCPF